MPIHTPQNSHKPSVPYYIFIIAGIIALVATLFHYQKTHQQLFITFHLAVLSDNEYTAVQLFYNAGNGYTENDSHIFPIRCNDVYQKHTLQIPYKYKQHLRFDPTNDYGKIRISNLTLTTTKNIFPVSINVKNIIPNQHIQSVQYSKDTVTINTDTNSTDPSLLLAVDATKLFPAEIKYFTLFWCKLFSIFSLALFTVTQLHRRNNTTSKH